MDDQALTLADLLLDDAPSVQSRLMESKVLGLSERLRMVLHIPFEKILPELSDELKKVLDISLKDILLGSLKA